MEAKGETTRTQSLVQSVGLYYWPLAASVGVDFGLPFWQSMAWRLLLRALALLGSMGRLNLGGLILRWVGGWGEP